MGLMKFLDKALDAYQKHLPEIMEYAEKIQEHQQKKEEHRYEQFREIDGYKAEYANISSEGLKAMLGSESGLKKKAITLILQERNANMLKWKATYSELTTEELRVEAILLNQHYSHYCDTPGQKLSEIENDTRKKLVYSILRERGVL